MKRKWVLIFASIAVGALSLGLVALLRNDIRASSEKAAPASPQKSTGPSASPMGSRSSESDREPIALETTAPETRGKLVALPHKPDVANGGLPDVAEMSRMNAGELLETEPGLLRELQAGLTEAVRDDMTECVEQARSEARTSGGDGRLGVQHTLVVAISARNGEAVVRDAKGDEGWPATVPRSLQTCLLDAFGDAKFPVDRDFDYQIEYPIVVR